MEELKQTGFKLTALDFDGSRPSCCSNRKISSRIVGPVASSGERPISFGARLPSDLSLPADTFCFPYTDDVIVHLTFDCCNLLLITTSRAACFGASSTDELVTRWMAANVAVAQDPAGNLKPAKDKSTERIDGIVALIMTIGRAMVVQEEPEPSYQMIWV